MRTPSHFTGLICILVTLMLPPGRTVSAASPPIPAAQVDCAALISQLTARDNWLEQLADPVLNTQAQVVERFRFYSDVHACIPAGSSSDLLQSARNLAEYFMIFAGGYQTPQDGSEFYLVDLATDKDPAVSSLRQKVGIAPPPGYVYMRFYSSRQAMPDLVRRLFKDPDVKGVTLFTRYVAVLADQSDLHSRSFPKTISHELVHAYLKSIQGISHLDAFPLWFDEGMATHFSGSSLPSCTISDYGPETLTSCSTSPQDYQQYAANFDFLQARLGQRRFLQLLKQSFEATDADMLYRQAGFSSYAAFAVEAMQWSQRRDTLTKTAIAAACILPLVIGLLIYFWRAGRAEEQDQPAPPHFPDLPYQSI
jgi:hypothetical protein